MVEHLLSMHEIPDSMLCVHAHAHMHANTHSHKCARTHTHKSDNAVVNEKVTGIITLESVVLEELSNQTDKRTEILRALREGHG